MVWGIFADILAAVIIDESHHQITKQIMSGIITVI